MNIILSNKILLSGCTLEQHKTIATRYTFNNPEHAEAARFGRSTWNIPTLIRLFAEHQDGIELTIGALNHIIRTFDLDVSDNRARVPAVIPFLGELRPYQKTFIDSAIAAGGGVMVAATGSGKTISGIALASRLQQRALILVKSKDLAKQWQDAIEQFTGLTAGLIGGGKNTEGEQFTIGLIQTLCKRDLTQLNYGLVIADECHNIPAKQAYDVINGLNARYKFGLSATPQRRDNLEFMIHAALGGVCSVVDQSDLTGKVLPVSVKTIRIGFTGSPDTWNEFLTTLVNDGCRNDLIIEIAQAVEGAGSIILCAQVAHCEALGELARVNGMDALVLYGQLPAKVRAERMACANNATLIIGTLSLLSEGIDLPHLHTLIFASPVSAEVDRDNPAATRLMQSIGRCRRPHGDKQCANVVDIIDSHPFGLAAFNKRREIYRLQGFSLSTMSL